LKQIKDKIISYSQSAGQRFLSAFSYSSHILSGHLGLLRLDSP